MQRCLPELASSGMLASHTLRPPVLHFLLRSYNFVTTAISSLNERSALSVTGQVSTPANIP